MGDYFISASGQSWKSVIKKQVLLSNLTQRSFITGSLALEEVQQVFCLVSKRPCSDFSRVLELLTKFCPTRSTIYNEKIPVHTSNIFAFHQKTMTNGNGIFRWDLLVKELIDSDITHICNKSLFMPLLQSSLFHYCLSLALSFSFLYLSSVQYTKV